MNFTKSIMALALAGMLFTSCKETAKEAIPETTKINTTASAGKPAPVGKVETASFTIEGMSCAVMCAAKIEKELTAMDGVQTAKVDFEKKTATVEYDNAKQSPEKLVEKVESVAGGKTYKVSNVKSTADHAMLMKGNQDKQGTAKDKKTSKKTTKETKAACCSGKKHCSKDEKSGSM